MEELGRRNTNLLTTPPAHPPPSPLSTLLLQSSQNVPSEMQRTCPLRLCLLWDKAPLYPSSSFTTVSVSSQTLPSPQAGGPVVPAPPGPCWPAPAPPAGNACLNPVFLPLISAQKLGYPPPPVANPPAPLQNELPWAPTAPWGPTRLQPFISGVILKWSAKKPQFLELDLGEVLETSNPVSSYTCAPPAPTTAPSGCCDRQ